MRPESLRARLSYEPRPLRFGTSGRRGDVVDLTQLEVYINALAELEYLLTLPPSEGGIVRGEPFYFGYDLRPSSTRFVPEQQGRGEIAQAIVQAIRDAGMQPVNLGRIPTPAVMYYALQRGKGSIMVTGSHIPFERNGYKVNTSRGELLKKDEEPINRLVELLRARIYDQPLADADFNELGLLKSGHQELPPETPEAATEYVRRYETFFEGCKLQGCRVLVYQHSAVGRDILVEILRGLGAEVLAAGRSESFVPIDTENIDDQQLVTIQSLVDDAEADAGALDAVVSSDGDSDRPLILGIEPQSRRVHFFGGDLVGMVVAEFLGADAVVVPISCNDAIDRGPLREFLEPKTRIGSPFVIAGMEQACARGRSVVCGWEANGGFLLGSDLRRDGRTLKALPTRDAVLPILCVLSSAADRRLPLTELFAGLPKRFSRAALLKRFPRAIAQEILKRLTPSLSAFAEVEFSTDGTIARTGDGRKEPLQREPERELCGIRDRLACFFTPGLGFSRIARINYVDGVRVLFDNGDIAHVRPSGNADELRIYAVADSAERAEAIARSGIGEPDGILRRMERWGRVEAAVAGFRAVPGILRLHGAVQHYDWGGFDFIPALLGTANRERRPFAELWIGTHPGAPAEASWGDVRVPLEHLVSAAAREVLGETAAEHFNNRLPFLLKILDVRTMLSIQAHPDRQRAAEGFARENAAGLDPQSPGRSYRDDCHKPEMHVALTEFWMLHGFRPLEEIGATLRSTPELLALMPDFEARLERTGTNAEGRRLLLRELYASAMTLPQERVDVLLDSLIGRTEKKAVLDRDSPDYWALRAAGQFPLPGGSRDRGIFSIYLLNLVHLSPGQGTFQPAGSLHAYLEGTNVEVMANSDNVLRGGLTAKHVDAAELLRILKFEDGRPEILGGERRSATESVYRTPAQEFELSRIEIVEGGAHGSAPAHAVDVLLVLEGSITVADRNHALDLGHGGSCLIPCGVAYSVRCRSRRAVLFKATVPGS